MRFLYLCQRIPYPPDRGDRIPVFHQVKRLSRNHDVVVGSLAHPGDHTNAEMLRRELGLKVIAPDHYTLHHMMGMAAAFLQGKPLSLGYFRNPKLQSLIDTELAGAQFDGVIVFSSSMAQYVEQYGCIPRIIHFCDVDSQKWSSMAQSSHGLMRWIYHRESRVLLQYEQKIAAEFDASCVVTHNEADLFQKHIPGIPVHVAENGVDVDYFAALPRRPEGLHIIFAGVMDYPPNIEAVTFFAKGVWKKIRTVHPEARFLIVGARPSRSVLNLRRFPGVEVTGYVPDIRPYLASATIAVAPLAIARGVQNKILEAMAAGIPVLTTAAVAGGLPSGAERHVFLAERDPELFGSALLELVANRSVLEKEAAAAQDFVRNHCTWDIKLKALDELLEKITAHRHLSQISHKAI